MHHRQARSQRQMSRTQRCARSNRDCLAALIISIKVALIHDDGPRTAAADGPTARAGPTGAPRGRTGGDPTKIKNAPPARPNGAPTPPESGPSQTPPPRHWNPVRDPEHHPRSKTSRHGPAHPHVPRGTRTWMGRRATLSVPSAQWRPVEPHTAADLTSGAHSTGTVLSGSRRRHSDGGRSPQPVKGTTWQRTLRCTST